MQNDPSRTGYYHQPGNFYANQYPPVYQPQFGAGNFYQPNPGPPPYAHYSQQPIIQGGYTAPNVPCYRQNPPYQHQNLVLVPVFRSFIRAQVLTTITSKFRAFLLISGIIYILSGALMFGLQIATIIMSNWTLYQGILTGTAIVSAGISMFLVACKTSHHISYLTQALVCVLMFCIIGVILSAINFSTSRQCINSWDYYYCDKSTVNIFKMSILIATSLSTVHTIINLIIVTRVQRKSIRTPPAPSAPGHQY